MELKKGPWSREEDQKLMSYIEQHGHGSWRSLPPKAGLERCGKSCRLRWTNYLRPDIKRGKFSPHEEKAVIRLHALLGNKWSAIAVHLPKRTANEIKNYWNTRLKKRLTRMGIDPATHKPKSNGSAQHADLSHMAQWETARLEAESRFSKLHLIGRFITAPPRPTFPCLDVLNAASWQANAGTLDFSFSNSTATVPKVSSLMENEAVVPAYNYVVATDEGKMENSSQVHSNYGVSMGAMDLAAADHNSEGYNVTGGGGGGGVGDIAGEFEDIMNYWNDLLMVPPGL